MNQSSRYTFLPWVRQGIAATVSSPSSQGDRLGTDIALQLNHKDELIKVPIALYGPGDITGLDTRQIVRTEPRHLTLDFEPNYLAAIEFDRPDFPWLFTPTAPDPQGNLLPWLCLIVVQKQPGVSLKTVADRPLPVLTIATPATPAKELPNLVEAWAWAHAQICWAPSESESYKAGLESELTNNSIRSVARLLCSRQLAPHTQYYACVVPTFARGRQAGLGEAVTAATTALAWDLEDLGRTLHLPVYYHWEFGTGVEGDFESLLRRLQVRDLSPEEVKPLPLQVPGFTPDLPGKTIDLEGALRLPEAEATGTVSSTWKTRLQEILNAAGSDPIVAPPIYGSVATGQPQVSQQSPQWLQELNLDPRYRIAAGLGVQVIRQQQETLMAAAWEQVGELQQVNRVLRQSQLLREISDALYQKHLQALPPDRLVKLTAPAQARLQLPDSAMQEQLEAQTQTTTSGTLRRVLRPRGPIARHLARSETSPESAQIQSFAAKSTVASAPTSPVPAARPVVSIPALPQNLLQRVQQSPVQRSFQPLQWGEILTSPPEAEATLAAKRWQTAMAEHDALRLSNGAPSRPETPEMAKPAAIQKAMMVQLHPKLTVLKQVQQRVQSDRNLWQRPDPLDPIAVTPVFPQPMYEPLRDLFQEMLLPGLENIPPNTITLLETNPKFIEAYMVGLNHEMSRELLWREYPVDQRGTYFRHFWDRRGQLTDQPTEDIPPLHQWHPQNHLGENLRGTGQAGQLLLLIRGDFLRHYPTATIYAVEAIWQGQQRIMGTRTFAPLFQGRWQPDVTFLGFPLTEAEAKGAAFPEQGHAGYFFVIQQQPSEPRFGLDVADEASLGEVPRNWRDLAWSHLVDRTQGMAGLQTLTHIPLHTSNSQLNSLELNRTRWGADAAHLAAITLQKPVRIAMHARTWLPES